MIPNLIEYEDARNHLRIDQDDDDAWLELWIPVVSEAIAAWLKDPYRLYEWQADSDGNTLRDENGNPMILRDTSGKPIIRRLVRGAALVELASQYAHREGDGKTQHQLGHWDYSLCVGATNLLTGIRKTTVR